MFSTAAAADGWTTVDDPVMGGRSASTVAWADGALEFSGVVSLENNGGFVSLLSPIDPAFGEAWGSREGVRLRGTGDGTTIAVQLRTGPDGASYVQRFVAEEPFDVLLSFAEFEATTRFLEPRPDALGLDPGLVVQVALYVLDKQEGPFVVRLEAIG